MTYLAMTVVSCFAVIFITAPANQNINTGLNTDGSEEVNAINTVIESFTTAKSITVSGNVTINKDEKPYAILKLDVNVDMSKGFENISLFGDITLDILNSKFEIGFTYLDNYLYIDYANGYYKINVGTAFGVITELCNVLGVDMGSLANIDTGQLLAMLDNVKEQNTADGNGKLLELDIEGLTVINILTDNDYNIKSIEIPSLKFSAYEIVAGMNIECYEEAQYTTLDPTTENEYLDTSATTDLLGCAINIIKQQAISGTVNLQLPDNDILQVINFDYAFGWHIDNAFATINTNLKGIDIRLTLKDGIVYVDISDLHFTLKTKDINSLITWINTCFDLNIEPINLDNPTDADSADQILTYLDIISHITQLDKGLEIGLSDKGAITIEYTQDTLDKIILEYEDLVAQIGVSALGDAVISPIIDTTQYVNYTDITNTIYKVKDLITSKQFAVNIDLDITGEQNIGLTGNILLDLGIKPTEITTLQQLLASSVYADLTLAVNSTNYNITLLSSNNMAYLTYNDIAIKVNVNELTKAIDLLLPKVSIPVNTLPQLQMDISSPLDILSGLQSVSFDNETYTIIIDGYKLFGEGWNSINIEVVLSDDIAIKAKNIHLSTLNSDLSLNLSFGEYTTLPNIESNSYLDITNLLPLIDTATKLTDTKSISGTLNFQLDNEYLNNLDVNFIINIENGIQAKFSTTLYGLDIVANLINDTIYIDAQGLKLKASINDLDYIINWLNNILPTSISVPQFNEITISIDDLLSIINNFDTSAINSINNVVGGVQILLSNGISATLYYDAQTINRITIDFGQDTVNATLNLSNSLQNIDSVDTAVYTPIQTALETIDKVISMQDMRDFAFTLSANIGTEITLAGDIIVSLPSDLSILTDINAITNIKAYANFTIIYKDKTYQMLGYLNNGQIYLEYNGMKISLAINEISSILDALDIDTAQSQNDIKLPAGINLENPLNMLELLQKITMSSNDLSITIDSNALYSTTGLNNIVLDALISDIGLQKLTINNLYLEALQDYIDLDINLNTFTGVPEPMYAEYLDISALSDAVSPIIDFAKSKSVTGSFIVSIDTGTNVYNATLNTTINYGEKIEAYISTVFNGLNIQIVFREQTIFANIQGLKVKFALSDINSLIEWINSEFGTTIKDITIPNLNDITINDINLSALLDTKLDLSAITSISRTENGINIALARENNISLTITNGKFSEIILKYDGISVLANLQTFTETQYINNVIETEYNNYTEITNLISNIIDTFSGTKFNIGIDAEQNIYNIEETITNYYSGSVAIDMTNNLLVDATATIMQNNLNVNFSNEYLYVDYEGLKIKIHRNNINEILAIAMNLFGIDPALLPTFSEISDKLEIDTSALTQIIPSLDTTDPLSILSILKDITYQDNTLSIKLNGNEISDGVDDIIITLAIINGKLNSISINNINDATNNAIWNITATLKDFSNISIMPEELATTYIDISSSSDLIKAVINTSTYKDYHIKGVVNVVANILNIPIEMSVDTDIQVKVVDTQPVVKISLTNIPQIIGVTNDISGKRNANIYYYDGLVYFEAWKVDGDNKKNYQSTCATLDEVFDNIAYYIQYVINFTDTITGAIDDAIKESAIRDGPIDVSNILRNYYFDSTSQKHMVTLNMAEIANNSLLGEMTVGIGVRCNEETGNVEQVYTLSLDFNMPLASICEITLKTDQDSGDLYLVDLGNELDFSDLYSFVDNYTYTINFDSNGGESVSSLSAKAGESITLPTLPNIKLSNSQGTRYDYYIHTGWSYSDGTVADFDTMPRVSAGLVLYANWEYSYSEEKPKYTLTFDLNGASTLYYNGVAMSTNSIQVYEGETVDLNMYTTSSKKIIGITSSFKCWKRTSSAAFKITNITITGNTTVYASFIALAHE